MYAKVMFSFPGTQKNEMPLTKGEIIPITHKGKAGGWSKGPKGAFPTDYVEFLPAGTEIAHNGGINAATGAKAETKPLIQGSSDPFAALEVSSGLKASVPAPSQRRSSVNAPPPGKDLSVFDSMGPTVGSEAGDVDNVSRASETGDKSRRKSHFEMEDIFGNISNDSSSQDQAVISGSKSGLSGASGDAFGSVNPLMSPGGALQPPVTLALRRKTHLLCYRSHSLTLSLVLAVVA